MGWDKGVPSESRLLCEYYEHHCPEIRLSKANVKSKQRSKEDSTISRTPHILRVQRHGGFSCFFKKTQKLRYVRQLVFFHSTEAHREVKLKVEECLRTEERVALTCNTWTTSRAVGFMCNSSLSQSTGDLLSECLLQSNITTCSHSVNLG